MNVSVFSIFVSLILSLQILQSLCCGRLGDNGGSVPITTTIEPPDTTAQPCPDPSKPAVFVNDLNEGFVRMTAPIESCDCGIERLQGQINVYNPVTSTDTNALLAANADVITADCDALCLCHATQCYTFNQVSSVRLIPYCDVNGCTMKVVITGAGSLFNIDPLQPEFFNGPQQHVNMDITMPFLPLSDPIYPNMDQITCQMMDCVLNAPCSTTSL